MTTSVPTATGHLERAVLWEKGNVLDLGTLGGAWSEPAAINEHAQIVGSSAIKNGEQHAFLWQTGKMSDLGTLPDGKTSAATDINDRGQIVGCATAKNGQTHAVLWTVRSG